MNSVERTLAALSGQKCDCTPVIPLIIQHALHMAGIPHSEYSTNPEMLAQAQLNAIRLYDYDGLHISSDNYIVSEALGNAVRFPADEPPQKVNTILSEKPDLSLLKKIDPATSGRMPVIIEATRIARQQLGDTKFIKTNCDSGPFSVASSLRGAENFFMDAMDCADYVEDLLEITSRAIIAYARAIAKAGAHAITYGESTASIVSRDIFSRYVLPYNRFVVEEIKKKTGLPVFVHMCGNVDHLVDLLHQTYPDAIELDSMTNLERAYEITSRGVCIEGTVDTVNVLLRGSVADVKAAAQQCIAASRGRRLILSSGCELPRLTPPENVHALVQAARELL